MRVRDKEHQSLGLKELEQLCIDNPNDSDLGLAIRQIVKAARINGYMESKDPYDNDEYEKSHDENEHVDWRKDTIWDKDI